jgi:pimeloyl-ACP methyl ester carboxylesterase
MGETVDEGQQSRFFKAPDGLNLHALVYGEENALTPVICLPGLTRPARDFAVLARHLVARRARRIVSIDYRGRGGSDWDPDWTHYSVPVEAGDIAAVLEQLGIGSAIFVGLSRGGLHAMLLGGRRPELVKAMVLDDIGPQLDPQGLVNIRNYIGRLPLLRDLEEAVAHYRTTMGARFPAISDAHWRLYAENSLNATPERMRMSYDPQLARTMDNFDPEAPMPDFWPQFCALAAPILALRGENSDLLSAEVFQQMAARQPLCQTFVVPGQGHAPLLFDAPTLNRIADFIEATDKADD